MDWAFSSSGTWKDPKVNTLCFYDATPCERTNPLLMFVMLLTIVFQDSRVQQRFELCIDLCIWCQWGHNTLQTNWRDRQVTVNHWNVPAGLWWTVFVRQLIFWHHSLLKFVSWSQDLLIFFLCTSEMVLQTWPEHSILEFQARKKLLVHFD